MKSWQKKDPQKAASVVRSNPGVPVSHKAMLAIVKGYGFNVSLFPDAPEDIQTAAVMTFPESLANIKNPSENVQKIAVFRDPTTIRFIKNPSEEIQEVAVYKSAMCIRFIESPKEKVQMAAFEKARGAFYETKNPCEELCLAAARHFGARILGHTSVNWKAAWVKDVIKTAMSKSPDDAYNCVSNFRYVPHDLAQFAFEKNYKCYSVIASKPKYDGFLDIAYAKKKRELEREDKLPLFGAWRLREFQSRPVEACSMV